MIQINIDDSRPELKENPPELRECPRCKGKPKYRAVNRGRWKAVECTQCGFKTKGCLDYHTARIAWNTEGDE